MLSRDDHVANHFEYLLALWLNQMGCKDIVVEIGLVRLVDELKGILEEDCLRLINWLKFAKEYSSVSDFEANYFMNDFIDHLLCFFWSYFGDAWFNTISLHHLLDTTILIKLL